MNVSLTPELEKFVDRKVESGLYNNASEVVREGLRLLKEHDEIRLKWREQIERGWLQAQRGELVDGTRYFTASTNASRLDRPTEQMTARFRFTPEAEAQLAENHRHHWRHVRAPVRDTAPPARSNLSVQGRVHVASSP